MVNVERFKHRAKDLRAAVSKELEEATLDAAGLRRLMQMKNKELRHMKTLAATILDQRSEIEQFFLEALQEVNEILFLCLCKFVVISVYCDWFAGEGYDKEGEEEELSGLQGGDG